MEVDFQAGPRKRRGRKADGHWLSGSGGDGPEVALRGSRGQRPRDVRDRVALVS